MPEELIIFDCDGVLVDSEPLSLGLLIEHCARHGLDLDMVQACDCFLGKPVAVASAEANAAYQASVPDVDLDVFQERILAKFQDELRPVAGVADALSMLDAPKCVASSSNLDRIKRSIELTGVSAFFSGHLFSTDMVARGKPHPDVFLHAAKEMGFEPRQAIVVEDSPAGLRAAKAAKMKTIAFAGGSHAQAADLTSKLSALAPDKLINNMADLPRALSALSAH
ncbi:MAG: HAD family hydrolase [Pseudomonadota bacterium]